VIGASANASTSLIESPSVGKHRGQRPVMMGEVAIASQADGEVNMPIHNWKRVKNLGLFHHFHLTWISKLCNALNGDVLPRGYFALIEQRAPRVEPDILALHLPISPPATNGSSGGLAVAEAQPRARFIRRFEDDATVYARKANRIAVRDDEGMLVAVIEIVSPGNKSSETALRSFVEKAADFIEAGVNVLIVDLFPPSSRDPAGLHKAIWDEIHEEPFDLPTDKPLTLASYDAGPPKTAYIEPVAVGDALPEMPLFLAPDRYVPTPLETTYMATWATCPYPLRHAVEAPISD